MTKLFEVQEFTLCDGWVNNWRHTHEDGTEEMEYFTSIEEAQWALGEHLRDYAEGVDEGYLEDSPSLDDFRIVEVTA